MNHGVLQGGGGGGEEEVVGEGDELRVLHPPVAVHVQG